MTYPPFFDNVTPITLNDPLAAFLGASGDGSLTYTYLDVVKLAGHSCPTTAGAFLMLHKGLETLYPSSLPVRGTIRVEMHQKADEDTTGVIASIASMVTGASDEKGFKGLMGSFARNNLLFFGASIPLLMRLTRTDTNVYVDIAYNPGVIPPEPSVMTLMDKIKTSVATEEEKKEFGILWQERVRKILLESNDVSGLVTIKTGS